LGECTPGSRYGRVYRQSIADVRNKFDDVRRQDRVGKCTSAKPYREKVTGKELSEALTSGECTSGSRYGRVYRQPIAYVGDKFADPAFRIGKSMTYVGVKEKTQGNAQRVCNIIDGIEEGTVSDDKVYRKEYTKCGVRYVGKTVLWSSSGKVIGKELPEEPMSGNYTSARVRRQDRVGKCTSEKSTSGSRYGNVYRQPIADVGDKFADAAYRIGKSMMYVEVIQKTQGNAQCVCSKKITNRTRQ
jgi:hypothetical protein